jgi:nucleoid-associated protein YgaU
MTPQEFVDSFGALADKAAAATGLSRWLFLTQWAIESAWGSSAIAVDCHNLAGLKDTVDGRCGNSEFGQFATYDRFAEVFEWEILHAGSPPGSGTYYAGLRAAAGASLDQQFIALGNSPWDAGHYEAQGRGPGSSLQLLYQESLASIASPLPEPPPGGGGQPNTTGSYTVQGGDSLSLIALRELGDASRWPQVYADNQNVIEAAARAHGFPSSENGHWIFPGEVLQLREAHDQPSPPPPPAAVKTYTVQSGDSLWLIAEKEYGDGARYPELYAKNAANIEAAARAHGQPSSAGGHWIYPGEVLNV